MVCFNPRGDGRMLNGKFANGVFKDVASGDFYAPFRVDCWRALPAVEAPATASVPIHHAPPAAAHALARHEPAPRAAVNAEGPASAGGRGIEYRRVTAAPACAGIHRRFPTR